MTEKTTESIKVNILDSTYQFKCQPEEVGLLEQAAAYLDQKLRYTRARSSKGRYSPPLALETTLLLTSLEITRELLELKQSQSKEKQEAQLIIQLLQEKIDYVLEKTLNDHKESGAASIHSLPPASQQK